ncbi:MAG: BREX system P-loop protein BrxC [Planctomycetes bacterium]|nr:BREX system P-loop protein BrxC [Planctomycetota bacterium]
MKIHELLDRDPRSSELANTGQAKIADRPDARSLLELRAELETFVCDGQYGDAIERILRGYLTHVDRPRQLAAWVSGFFGSGKSHLLKMLTHLWVDTIFSDGASARSLVRGLPSDVLACLRELDTLSRRAGRPAFAAAGSLPQARADDVRRTVLAILLRAAGLPASYPQARFCFWMRERGFLDSVRDAVASAGKDWTKELNHLYASPVIAKAVIACDPQFAPSEMEARQVLRELFPDRGGDLSTDEFLSAARNALSDAKDLPHTILVLDEAQQYIGDSGERATIFTELAEAVATGLDARVLLVAAGQSALSSAPTLQKLRDRFRITAQLSDTDVETVTRKVLLQKKPSSLAQLSAILDRNAGEISKHLSNTRLCERSEDKKTRDLDYPLLPTRRRFWEEAFRVVDRAGSRSQLRSQLHILHDALRGIADRELGAVIPASVLFDALSADLINNGVLPNEIANRIRELDDGTEPGRLRQQLCGLIFLINKLPRDPAVDTGVRANARMLADLLVADLVADSGPFRRRIDDELENLAADGKLLRVQDEYHLQTSEGAEWERAFREKSKLVLDRSAELHRLREQALSSAVQEIVDGVRLQQGLAKLKRSLVLHARSDDPPADGERVTVWLRSEWDTTAKRAEEDARRRGIEDPVVHVLVKGGDDVMKTRIAELEAARQLLAEKGVPSAAEGLQARESMLSRQQIAQQDLAALVQDLLASARVLQGGGNDVYGDSLAARIESAARDSLVRLFPRFAEADADHRAWESALRRAREGSDQPFQPLQWDRAVEDHPVSRELLACIGGGKRGTELRRELKAPPFGWPQDAIDAALIALHRAGTLRATLNGQALTPGQLDQTKIQSAEFRPERVKLGSSDKLALRGLFQKLGPACKTGEEERRAPDFLDALLRLFAEVGGEAPLPAPRDRKSVEDLRRLSGADQLDAILKAKAELETAITDSFVLQKRAQQRRAGWDQLVGLMQHAEGLPVHAELAPQLDAIRAQRSLLGEVDPVPPLAAKLGAALRAALNELHAQYERAHREGMSSLAADASWSKVGESERAALSQQHGLVAPQTPVLKSDQDLADELRRQTLSARRATVAAVPERVRQLMADVAKKLQPKARRVALPAATLATADEVRAWVREQEERLLMAVKQGPVIVG